LLYNEGLMGQAAAVLGGHLEGARQLWLRQRLQLFTASHVRQLLHQQQQQDKQQQQQQQQQQKLDGNAAAQPSSSTKLLVLGPKSDPCFWQGFSFAVFSGLSPGQVEAVAAADPFQSWELAFSGRRGAAAAAAWQQHWQEYGMGQRQWQQQVQQLRRQQQQQQQEAVKWEDASAMQGDAAQHSQSLIKGSAVAGGGVHRGQLLVLSEQQHSELQQQLLQLPPSKVALSYGKSLRLRRLLLLVDDVAAASSAACSSSRGRALRQLRAVWSTADRQQLQAIQQQQQRELEEPPGGNAAAAAAVQRLLADGTSSSIPAAAAAAASSDAADVQELGVLLPPLVLSAKRRLVEATPLLRSMWGALIPPVLSPPVALVCNAAGLVAQQAALTAAPW
jgi:hypothetical protein